MYTNATKIKQYNQIMKNEIAIPYVGLNTETDVALNNDNDQDNKTICQKMIPKCLKNFFQRDIFQSKESTRVHGLLALTMMTMTMLISIDECPFYANHITHKQFGNFNLLEDTSEYCLGLGKFQFLKRFVSDFLAIGAPWTALMINSGAYFGYKFFLADLKKEDWGRKFLAFLSMVGIFFLSIFSDGNFGKDTPFPVHPVHIASTSLAYGSLWAIQVVNIRSHIKSIAEQDYCSLADLAELALATVSATGAMFSMVLMESFALILLEHKPPYFGENKGTVTQYEWYLVMFLGLPYLKPLIKPKGEFRITANNFFNWFFILLGIVGGILMELHVL
jgi:hypothetical protein